MRYFLNACQILLHSSNQMDALKKILFSHTLRFFPICILNFVCCVLYIYIYTIYIHVYTQTVGKIMHLYGNVIICHTQMKCADYEFIIAFQKQDTHLSRIKIYRPFMLNETFKLIFSCVIIPFKKTTPSHLIISILFS